MAAKVGDVPFLGMDKNRPDQTAIRSQFPALESGFAFLENAGGSQLPRGVIQAMSDFMRDSYVQTTAGYPASDRATKTALDAHSVCETLMGADNAGKVVLGASTTQLVFMLAEAFSRALRPGDEIIVSQANHEANAGPWARLERFGVVVKWWGVDKETGASSVAELESLFSDQTKLVVFPHTSNLLGNIIDVRAVTKMVHAAGGQVVVDGVAYAPHGLMDVREWDCDFYVFSAYKVYGPHIAALYGKNEAWAGLEGANHFFVDPNEVPRKFELGCLSYEACAGLVAVGDYYAFLAGRNEFDRETVRLASETMGALEQPLVRRLVEWLQCRRGVRMVGPGVEGRVPTVSFVSNKTPSSKIADHVNQTGIGIRNGHMYSHRLTTCLGVDPDEGFVRVSAVHYNTEEELARLFERLEEVV